MFDTPLQLALGLLTGFAFGLLLQKAHLTRYRVIVGQFLLKDFTMLKTMLTAILVGGIGVYALHAFGGATLHVKPLMLGGVAVGAALFGVGMALLGYCPGTAVGAAAEGSRHALWGILGMLAGAAAYAEAYSWLSRTLLAVGNYGELTLPTMTGLSPWAWWTVLTILALALFAGLARWQQRGRRGEGQPGSDATRATQPAA